MGEQRRSEREWMREAAAWRARAEHLQATVDRLRSLAVAGESAGFLAHELNNLYTPVVGYCHAAQAPGADDVIKQKAIAKALAAAERVTDLAGAILQLSGSASERGELVGECELRSAVEAGLMVLGAERWMRDGVGVSVDVPRGTQVAAKTGVVQQVVMNLVLNARRAMEGRRGTIHIRGETVGGIVRLEVRDGGVGMKAEVIQRYFGITKSDHPQHGRSGALMGDRPGVERAVDARSGGHNEEAGVGELGERYLVDVQELARSGSINGQARWGVKLKGDAGRETRDASGGGQAQITKPKAQIDGAGAAGEVNAQARKKIAGLSAGKVPASMSPIKVWDAREVAAELREEAAGSAAAAAPQGGRRAVEPDAGQSEVTQHLQLTVQAAKRPDVDASVVLAGEPGSCVSEREAGEGWCGGDCRGGSGLGLALCLELVTRVGGRMWAESTVGEGTVVVVEWVGVGGGRGLRAA